MTDTTTMTRTDANEYAHSLSSANVLGASRVVRSPSSPDQYLIEGRLMSGQLTLIATVEQAQGLRTPTLTNFTCPGCGFEGEKFDHHDGTFTELCGDCRDEASRAINGWTPENSLD